MDPRCSLFVELKRGRTRRAVAWVAALSMLSLGAVSASSPSTKRAEGATITPNYKDAELGEIIQAVSEVTGKNFIMDARVNAKVTSIGDPDVACGVLRSLSVRIAGVRRCCRTRGRDRARLRGG